MDCYSLMESSPLDKVLGKSNTVLNPDTLFDFDDDFQIGDIAPYLDKGFRHVAQVCLRTDHSNEWNFKNMNVSMMFSKQPGWIYIITLEGNVYKIGSTSSVLGRRSRQGSQPIVETWARLGRYRGNFEHEKADTDERIRCELFPALREFKEVSFYAKSFAELDYSQIKVIEKELIQSYINMHKMYPPGNHIIG